MLMAEGFVFELERRGYLQMGPWSPASIISEPGVYKQMHVETLRAGTDIVVACTYYAHREKLRMIDREATLEDINRTAIKIAKEANDEVTGGRALIAGNICNTNVFEPNNPAREAQVRSIFREQIDIAKAEGVDVILAETFSWADEALIATEEIKAAGLPSIVNMAIFAENSKGQKDHTNDGLTVPECLKKLQDEGATVAGLNCFRGPNTTLPLLQQSVAAGLKGPFAALPMGYRTDEQNVTHWSIEPEGEHFPGLEKWLCDRYDWARFAVDCAELRAHGNDTSSPVAIVGTCCAGWVHHVRAMAEALGRRVPASAFSPDMKKHTFLGTDTRLGSDMNRIKGTGGIGIARA
jgi:betaine-homocysteine S-methyltransferase